jgi:uncharacterized heparinase superfamily protein
LDEKITLENRLALLQDISNAINSNQLKLEAYPVSMRMIHSLIFIQQYKIEDEKIIKAIAIQCEFLKNNLEFHLMANHLLTNYIALVMVFSMTEDDVNKLKYFKLLIAELNEQVLTDGAHYERAPGYHAHILYLLLLLKFNIYKSVEADFSGELTLYCQKMYNWLMKITGNGLHFPLFNDSISAMAIDFQNIQILAVAINMMPVDIQLKESGFRILQNEQAKLIINCGNIMPSYQPGHAHADMLHFIFYFKDEPILVDTGISTYENIEKRLLEKSTRMHNTVSWSDENQSQLWSSFRIANRASIKILNESSESVTAEMIWHNGILHRRTFRLNSNEVIIEDLVKYLPSNELAVAGFHFSHHLKNSIQISHDKLQINDSGLEFEFIHAEKIKSEPYTEAVDFNECRQALKISAYFAGHLKTTISWKA